MCGVFEWFICHSGGIRPLYGGYPIRFAHHRANGFLRNDKGNKGHYPRLIPGKFTLNSTEYNGLITGDATNSRTSWFRMLTTCAESV